ncbi:glycosyltransferase family A protein [Selenomonas ruminantium]|uniref:Glycosyl transferase family 2 n=1 Tax=Selenomonas ruminantium TaxID=971 RepID=A0A1I0YHZ7_SELRU|nr:glycosyltransferase family A protein [Selenomonas ruminantium]SFB11988.1 Glycosyl transferase family 2 [Selenomonas ruminantium]
MEKYSVQFTESYKKHDYVTAEILWRLLHRHSQENNEYNEEISVLRNEALSSLDEEGKLAYAHREINHDCYYWLALLQHITDLDSVISILSGTREEKISPEEQELEEEFSDEMRLKALPELKRYRKADEWLLVYLAQERETDILPHELYFLSSNAQILWQRLREEQKKEYLADLPHNLPLVSIMIPTYNRPAIFLRTMRSAAIQEYPNLEIIVCDNSTNEDTARIMEYYQYDKRIRYVRNRSAKNKAENFEPFEKISRGEYLQWLMDDDVLAPHKISQMAIVLYLNNTISLVGSQRGFIDENGNTIADLDKGVIDIDGDAAVFAGAIIGYNLLRYCLNFIGEPSAVLFRRSQLQHHYWRAESFGCRAISDVAMWLELLMQGAYFCFKDSLSFYRRHSGQEGQQLEVCMLSRIEWADLLAYYYKQHIFIEKKEEYHAALSLLLSEYKDNVFPYEESSGEMWHKYDDRMKWIEKIIAKG